MCIKKNILFQGFLAFLFSIFIDAKDVKCGLNKHFLFGENNKKQLENNYFIHIRIYLSLSIP